MSEHVLVQQCSPTLAGIKTGNLFPCAFRSDRELRQWLRTWNRKLAAKGVRFVPMRYREGRALIYAYRPSSLRVDLLRGDARALLHERGYVSGTPGACIAELIRKMKRGGEFPHEIGLFLGYPCEDVRGFIENRARGCKCIGCWKVYGNEGQARALFAKYQTCTDVYCRQWRSGRTIEQLTVAGSIHNNTNQ